MGYIEGEDRNQIILFPESIDEYVSDNNSIRIIDEYIKQLDLESLHFKRAATPLMGRPTLSPQRYA
jgi:transposase